MARRRKNKPNGTLSGKQSEHDGSTEPRREAAGRGLKGQAEKAAQLPGSRDQVGDKIPDFDETLRLPRSGIEIVVNRGTAETVPGTAGVVLDLTPAEENSIDLGSPAIDLPYDEEQQAIAQYVGDEVFRTPQPKLSFYRVKDLAQDYPPLELVLLAGVTTLSFKMDDERVILVDDAELNDAQVALNLAEGPLKLDPLVEYVKLRTVRTQG